MRPLATGKMRMPWDFWRKSGADSMVVWLTATRSSGSVAPVADNAGHAANARRKFRRRILVGQVLFEPKALRLHVGYVLIVLETHEIDHFRVQDSFLVHCHRPGLGRLSAHIIGKRELCTPSDSISASSRASELPLRREAPAIVRNQHADHAILAGSKEQLAVAAAADMQISAR